MSPTSQRRVAWKAICFIATSLLVTFMAAPGSRSRFKPMINLCLTNCAEFAAFSSGLFRLCRLFSSHRQKNSLEIELPSQVSLATLSDDLTLP